MHIGFIGIGNMGLPMAEQLLSAGHQLTVHDQREDAIQPLIERQALAAASAREMADALDTIIVSLPSLESLRDVCLGREGIVEGKRLKTIINTCTVGAPLVEEIERACAARDIVLLDCPISAAHLAPEREHFRSWYRAIWIASKLLGRLSSAGARLPSPVTSRALRKFSS